MKDKKDKLSPAILLHGIISHYNIMITETEQWDT